jgi:hypothetical protein
LTAFTYRGRGTSCLIILLVTRRGGLAYLYCGGNGPVCNCCYGNRPFVRKAVDVVKRMSIVDF